MRQFFIFNNKNQKQYVKSYDYNVREYLEKQNPNVELKLTLSNTLMLRMPLSRCS